MKHLAYYLANGPSLANIDLESLPREHSFGMNAAYRHWEKRNWWPAYYSSIDPVVSESHAGFIKDAVENSLFKGMMVSRNVLAVHPGLEERVVENHRGLIFFGEKPVSGFHKYFGGWARSFGTTGAWTIRYGAALGYQSAVLLGYDLSYKKTGTRVGGPLSLKRSLKEGETSSSNYFFHDYQRPGDLFQVANPGFLPFDLHRFAVFQSSKHISRMEGYLGLYHFASKGLDGFRDLRELTHEELINLIQVSRS
jgi:hypothetical protein